MNLIKKSILLSFICVASFSAVIITPALPVIQTTFQLTDEKLQWTMSLFLIGYLIGQLLYGPLANRFGTIKALRIGFVINIAGILLCLVGAFNRSYSLLLLGRLLSALGSAAGLTCTFMLIKKLLQQQEAKQALAFSIVSFSLGTGLAVSLGGFLTEHFGWQSCFWALLAHGTLMLACTRLFCLTEMAHNLNISAIIAGYLQALRNKTLIVYSCLVGFASVVAYCYSTAAPIISQSLLQLTPAQYGLWNLINLIGMMASGFLGVLLVKRYALSAIIHTGMTGIGLAIISLCAMSLVQTPTPLWFFISTALLYFFSGIIYPCAAHYATHAIDNTANASSMMSFINMLSATICVIILGSLPFSQLVDLITILSAFLLFTLASSKLIHTPNS